MKEKLPLNQQDIKKLWNHLLPAILFPVVVIGMFYAFFSVFFKDSSFFQDKIGVYMLMGFSLFFFGIIAWMIWSYAMDLRSGFKYRIEGKITDKELRVHTSTSHTSGGKTGNSSTRSSTTRHYYVTINGVQYSIEQEHYGKLKVGATIAMEKAPKSNVTLFLEVGNLEELSSEKSMDATEEKRTFLNSTPQKVPFNQDDFKVLKRGFWAQAKFRLIWFLPPMLIVLSLVANGMQAFLVFLFPLVLIPTYQLLKFMRDWKQYNSNKQYAYKEGIPTIVEDKSKHSHNGSHSNNVKTSYGTVKVHHKLYQQLSVGDHIILHKPANGKQILSITTAANEEVYLV